MKGRKPFVYRLRAAERCYLRVIVGEGQQSQRVAMRARAVLALDRGERIVMEIAGTTRKAARAAIGAAGGSVRTAIVMVRREVSRSAAEALLAASDNHLRPILGDPPPVEPG